MRSSILLLAASLAVSVSASVLQPRLAPNLPDSAFPKFHPITFEELQAGKDLEWKEHNATHTRGLEDSVHTVQTRDAASCANNYNMRYEWRQFSTSDRLAFIGAIKCLMGKPPSGNFPPATNRYEDLVRLHQLYMPNIHGNAKFLIWHRYYLWTFEQVLRTECGFNRAFPWWDETLDAGNFAQSDMFTNTDYFGHLPPPNNGNPVCIISGAFAGMTCNIGPGSSNIPHCLSRAVDESQTGECNAGFVNMCNSRTSYSDMESCSEGG
jgi:tyrosinase